MAKVQAYLGFDGQCKEAMSFYQKALGGELFLMKVSESGAAKQMPPHMQDLIMHSSLNAGNFTLLGSDMASNITRSESMSLMVDCSSREEIETLFAALSEGGEVTQPLMDSFWGATFGTINDRYGVRWMFNWEQPKTQ